MAKATSIIILFLDNKVIYDVIYNQFPLRNFDGNKGWYRRVTVEECHVSISLRLATCVSTSIMRSVMRWKGLTCMLLVRALMPEGDLDQGK